MTLNNAILNGYPGEQSPGTVHKERAACMELDYIECGNCVHDSEYFCSDECLHTTYSPEEYNELCEEDSAYWTQWEEGE